MSRFALVALLPVLLLGATHWASTCLLPAAPETVEARGADGDLVAEGPVVYANAPSEVRIWRGALLVSHRDALVALPAILPPAARVQSMRLSDLNGDGRTEIFLTLEYDADTHSPRRVEEQAYGFFADPGSVEGGEIRPFLSLATLVDAKTAGDSTPWEEISSYTPDDAPAGRFPDLVVTRTRYVYHPGDRFTPATLAATVASPPARLSYDPATLRYGTHE